MTPTLAVMALLCACTAPATDNEPSAQRQESATPADAPAGLTCARQKRAQAYPGRSFATVSKAARWGVPANGEVGDVLKRNRYTLVFAILNDSGDVVAELGIERLNGGWARASRTTCA